MKTCQSGDILSKKQVGQIVLNIFNKVKIVQHKGSSRYKGLRLNFMKEQPCTTEALKKVASEYGFFQLNDNGSTVQYAHLTGYHVNRNQQMKTITINNDNSFKVSVGGIPIDLSILGLNDIILSNVTDARIIFNTVKQSNPCMGKSVNSKLNTTKFSAVQEWSRKDDENSCEIRLTSGKCHGIVPFTFYSNSCYKCQQQSFTEHKKTSENNTVTKEELIKTLFPGASEIMTNLLTIQSNICESSKDARGRRWSKDIIQVALTFWNRSPQAYASLKSSGMIFLPSENLLQRYKNCFEQTPGLNDNMFIWMFNESKRLNVDKHGGLILDEMAVQEDLKMGFSNKTNKIDGLTDIGSTAEYIHTLNTHKNDVRIATHMMQFMFLSFDGFRFPFAYFPTTGANTPEIYLSVWDSISKLSKYEFTVDYICLDGASNNRAFQQMHFHDVEESRSKHYTTYNPFRPSQGVTLLMDYSHNIKKLRNNIHSSGDHVSCTRKLEIGSQFIVWNHWIQAFNWDRCHNCVRVHQKLTNEHIYLSKNAKMRNHLAEDVLNKDMLFLMQKYQQSLGDGSHLDKTIELLEHTSKIIDLFRDRRPVADINDERLTVLTDFETWIDKWLENVQSKTNLSASDRAKKFISKETHNDLLSMLRGFKQICRIRIINQQRSVVPAGVNSDVIENFFCQQRTICHGSNSNPTVHQYKYAVNSIILGQNAVSKKSNASNKRKSVQPFCISAPQTLAKKPKLRL